MMRFIWNSWWRNKGRFILLLVGALIVSTGLSYLVGVTQSNSGTVVDELQQRWKSSYHIVVRPADSRSVTEELNLLEPNYQSGLSGGITMEQLETVKGIGDVEVAAPIAMIGFVDNETTLERVTFQDPGIYRVEYMEELTNGNETQKNGFNSYYSVGWADEGMGEHGTFNYEGDVPLSVISEVMLAGVDPEAENALVGLEGAVVEGYNSRYFEENDKATQSQFEEMVETNIPVLLSNVDFVESKQFYNITKLDISFPVEERDKTMESIKEKGGEQYLDKQEGEEIESYSFTSKEAHEKYIKNIVDPSANGSRLALDPIVLFKASPVEYRPVSSPFPERWPFAYEVKPYLIPDDVQLLEREAYRQVNLFGERLQDGKRLRLDIKGVYDPTKLEISKDPLTELPMETYFPAKSNLVMDEDQNPVNPPVEMMPTNNPYGFLTKPPMMLTTLEAAEKVLGEEPVSSIRVKVKGVETMNDESEKRLQAVADQIEKETGLITDITLGSSPQPALTHVPGLKGKEGIGWVEQQWIKIGSSMTIFKEAKVGLSAIIASVILVAIVYVFSSNLIMMFTRKKEFAVLLSIGWRPNQLSKLLFMEAILLGSFVSLVSWVILGYFYVSSSVSTSIVRFILIGCFGLLIYLLGTVIPAILVRKIKPYEAMRSGEITAVGRRLLPSSSIFTMSVNHFIGTWKRSILSIVSIALPTGLFILFLFITFRLKGVMFATWLGEYVAMEVGAMHYIAMGVALLIAILTTTEIIWQNVSERKPEIALLKSVGWKNGKVRRLVLYEGLLSGLAAGILGLVIAITAIWRIYGEFPMEHLPFILACILIPIATGMLGALFPAAAAVKVMPYQALGGSADTSEKTEKGFKVVLVTGGIILFAGMIAVLANAVPQVKESASEKVDPSTVKGTDGETESVFKQEEKKEKPEDKDSEEDRDSQSIENKAWMVAELGDEVTEDQSLRILFKEAEAEEPISPENPDNRIITLQGEFYLDARKDDEYSIDDTEFTLKGLDLMDDQNNVYTPVQTNVLEKEKWNNIKLLKGGHVILQLSFEVPKDATPLYMRRATSGKPRPYLLIDLKGMGEEATE
ncbi:ABC transporter permease [Rossellomorea marisflavi]|uniref:ABC3 transporter permease C-terminal domain-containing protein n=1 Tax=Rossellomorea marisflavi TaxID=189381 RepID=A0A163LUP1_9BACI|nr:ABC transporter permease [Rossellomorea marisflavi]KZE51086.1 hypothetical protein AV649_17120 [Rossellomorea marisflavi]